MILLNRGEKTTLLYWRAVQSCHLPLYCTWLPADGHSQLEWVSSSSRLAYKAAWHFFSEDQSRVPGALLWKITKLYLQPNWHVKTPMPTSIRHRVQDKHTLKMFIWIIPQYKWKRNYSSVLIVGVIVYILCISDLVLCNLNLTWAFLV